MNVGSRKREWIIETKEIKGFKQGEEGIYIYTKCNNKYIKVFFYFILVCLFYFYLFLGLQDFFVCVK